MKKVGLLSVVGAIILQILLTISPIRSVLTLPLVMSQADATGDAAYVLSGGKAIFERLRAACDLYHMHRIKKIFLMQNAGLGSYSYNAGQCWNAAQWHVEYLKWLDIPEKDIISLHQKDEAFFGTLSEARLVADKLPDTVFRLVIITSPQHTRRSFLAFRRALSSQIVIIPYAASEIQYSSEFYHPLGLEYLKLVIYWFVA